MIRAARVDRNQPEIVKALRNIGEMKGNFVVYISINAINGKFYIGKTFDGSIQNGYNGSGKALKRAIKKYGKRNICSIILYDNLTEKDAYEIEQRMIDDVRGDKQCYNIDRGGAGCFAMTGRTHTEATKSKMREKAVGRLYTEETRAKMSASGRIKVFTDEHKRNISLGLTGKKRIPFTQKHKDNISAARNIPVEKIDPITSKVIDSFGSVTSAAKSVGLTAGSISCAIRNNHKSAGYNWRLKV